MTLCAHRMAGVVFFLNGLCEHGDTPTMYLGHSGISTLRLSIYLMLHEGVDLPSYVA